MVYPDVSVRYVSRMTDTPTQEPTSAEPAPAPESATDALAAAQAEAEAAQARVAALQEQQAAEAAAAETALADEHLANLTPTVPEPSADAEAIADPAVRGVIAELFDHLASLAHTLEEHAHELVHLGSSSSSSSAPAEPEVPASTSQAPGPGFALDGEPVARATAGTGDLPAGT